MNLAYCNPLLVEFFKENASIVVGDGNRIKFWCDRWFRNIIFKEEFPRLFNISVEKEVSLNQISLRRSNSSN